VTHGTEKQLFRSMKGRLWLATGIYPFRECKIVKLRYWFAAAATLISISLLIGANVLLQSAVPYAADDVDAAEDLLRRYAKILNSAVITAVATGIAGALVAFLGKRRELAIAFLFALMSILVVVVGATLAFSRWDWVYVPAACALGLVIGRFCSWNSLAGLSGSLLLASVTSTFAMKLFMWLA
jgi:ABC-type multidrug transport system fused ATPase/permease subunit